MSNLYFIETLNSYNYKHLCSFKSRNDNKQIYNRNNKIVNDVSKDFIFACSTAETQQSSKYNIPDYFTPL